MGIGSAAGLALTTWLAGHLEWALPAHAAVAACSALGGALLGRRIAGVTAPIELRWDGRQWHVDGVEGVLEVMLDVDRWLLLLRHRPVVSATPAGARWLAVSFTRGADDLRALRTALYSRPPEATPDLQPPVRAPDRATD